MVAGLDKNRMLWFIAFIVILLFVGGILGWTFGYSNSAPEAGTLPSLIIDSLFVFFNLLLVIIAAVALFSWKAEQNFLSRNRVRNLQVKYQSSFSRLAYCLKKIIDDEIIVEELDNGQGHRIPQYRLYQSALKEIRAASELLDDMICHVDEIIVALSSFDKSSSLMLERSRYFHSVLFTLKHVLSKWKTAAEFIYGDDFEEISLDQNNAFFECYKFLTDHCGVCDKEITDELCGN